MGNKRLSHLPFIFDFDGVLVDSVPEVLETTYIALRPDAPARSAAPAPFAHLFRANRWLVQPAGDLLVLGRWCLANMHNPSALLDRATWLTLLAEAPDREPERRAHFFATRGRLIPQDRSGWLSLHKTFEPLWSTLLQANASEVLILTNKNQDAVIELTSHFGLPLKAEWIFSGDSGASKHQNLRRLFSQYPWATGATFIDDSIYNLQELQHQDLPSSFNLALATWGYLGPQDISLASQSGIRCLTCSDVAKQCQEEDDL